MKNKPHGHICDICGGKHFIWAGFTTDAIKCVNCANVMWLLPEHRKE